MTEMPVRIKDEAHASHGDVGNNLFRDVSIELLPEQAAKYLPQAACFDKGSLVFLTHIPGKPISVQLDAAKVIIDRGFEPVPHLAARNFASEKEYADHLLALTRLGVKTVLLLGGNPSSAVPPMPYASDLLRHPAMKDSGVTSIFMAGHPEGHTVIPKDALIPALHEKIALARELNIKPQIVTQFAFDGAAMGNWAKELRDNGIDAPIRFGMAGVTSLPKLIKFAATCGVGASLSALTRQGTSLFKAMRDQDPDDVIAGLETSLADNGVKGISLHFFPFGGWEKTLKWIDEQQSKNSWIGKK